VPARVRADLDTAHAEAWAEIGRSGACLTGRQRVELAATVLRALSDPEPPPPWVGPLQQGWLPADIEAPAVAHDIVFRLGCHAGTVTESWYRSTVGDLAAPDVSGELVWIELVALTSTIAAIWSFRRAAGLEPWELPVGRDDPPTGEVAPEIESATLNWVPVAAPADRTASVVQAFTALPAEDGRTWRLAEAQYMSDAQMVDPRFTRGTLTRPEMELVALRVAQRRDCFF
jgi:hypothetical protein